MGLGHSGGHFLNSLFDYHKKLLTVPFGGMSDFHYIYEKCLKNNTFDEAVKKIVQSKDDKLISLVTNALFRNTKIDYDIIFSIMNDYYFSHKYIPTKTEWFKAFYVSYNIALGRNFDESNPPAIYFYQHTIGQHILIKNYYEIFNNFDKFYALTIIRRPSYAISSMAHHLFSLINNNDYPWANYLGIMRVLYNEILHAAFGLISPQDTKMRGPLFIPRDDEFLSKRRAVKFEDLKLKPLESLFYITNFLDLPYDDSLLHSTENGNNYHFYSSAAKAEINNFDISPVFNPHNEVFSEYDHKRIEILFNHLYKFYDYDLLYNSHTNYSKDDIISLFDTPFLFEEKFIECEKDLKDEDIQKSRQTLRNTIKYIVETIYPIIEKQYLVPLSIVKNLNDNKFNNIIYKKCNNLIFGRDLPYDVITTQLSADYPKGTDFINKLYNALFSVEVEYTHLLVHDIIQQNIQGEFVEFGIYQGTWINIFYDILKKELAINRQIWGFDSFEGLPEPISGIDSIFFEKGMYSCDYKTVSANVSLDERTNIHLVKGFFSDTLKDTQVDALQSIAYARIDCDLYESAKECLQFLGPRLVDKAVLVFDDWLYNSSKGECKAFYEWVPTVPYLSFEYLAFPMKYHLYLRVHKR